MADMDKRPLSGSYIHIRYTVSPTVTCRVPMIKYPMHRQIENTCIYSNSSILLEI